MELKIIQIAFMPRVNADGDIDRHELLALDNNGRLWFWNGPSTEWCISLYPTLEDLSKEEDSDVYAHLNSKSK